MAKNDWSQDERLLKRGGLASPPMDARVSRMQEFARSSYDIVLRDVVRNRGIGRIADMPLLLTASPFPNAALLGHSEGSAIVLHAGLLQAFDAATARALDLPGFLADFLPPSMDASDAKRREYAIHLFMHMVDFVLHHEIAHDLRGHLDLLPASLRGYELDELDSLKEIESGDETFRLLEFDADLHALDLQIGSMAIRSPLAEWPKNELEDALFLHLLATILCFQVLDRRHAEISNRAQATHPAPVHRAILYCETAVDSLVSHRPLDRSWLVGLHDAAWHEASIVAKAAGMPQGRWHGEDMTDAGFRSLNRARVFDFCNRVDVEAQIERGIIRVPSDRGTPGR